MVRNDNIRIRRSTRVQDPFSVSSKVDRKRIPIDRRRNGIKIRSLVQQIRRRKSIIWFLLLCLFVVFVKPGMKTSPESSSEKNTFSELFQHSYQQVFRKKWIIGSPLDSDEVHTSVFGETDNLMVGKSCILVKNKWLCRDCGVSTSSSDETKDLYKSYSQCPIMKRKGICPEIQRQRWDDPQPRSFSTYETFFTRGVTKKLTRQGIGRIVKDEYIQAQCSLTNTIIATEVSSCFDLNLCKKKKADEQNINIANNNSTNTGMELPMKVFPTGKKTKRILRQMIQQDASLQKIVTLVSDPKEACLFYSMHDVDTIHTLESDEWKQHNGKNHFLMAFLHSDQPFHENEQYGMAAIMTPNQSDQQLRSGYDMSIPLPVKWQVPDNAREIVKDVHRPRKYLLSFRGTVQSTLPQWHNHRWIAGEYWSDDADVAVDIQCSKKTIRGKKQVTRTYDDNSEDVYSEYLLNSTFGFCPGGSGVSSYRFGEVLLAGGIPVLVPGTIPPLHPEIDWSGCIVTVSESRIVDLPRLLRKISPEEIKNRQEECQRLHTKLFESETGLQSVALKIWVERIRSAIEFERRMKVVNDF